MSDGFVYFIQEEVTDNINENNEIFSVKETHPVEEIPPVIKLTEQEKAFDENNDGKIDIEEQKKLDEFLEKIKNPFDNKDPDGPDDEDRKKGEEEGKRNGEGEGFGEGLGRAEVSRKGDKTLDCAQGKGTGNMSIETIVDADGNIVDINIETFRSTIAELTNATKTQKNKLFECIKEKYKVDPSIGNDKSNKLFLLELNFKN